MNKRNLKNKNFMKKIVRTFTQGALVLTLTFAGFSCKKDGDSIMPAMNGKNSAGRITEGVELHNGRLVFQDIEAFKSYMNGLQERSMDEVIANDAANEMESLREYYEAIDGVGDDADVTTDQLFASGQLLNVPDLRFASVLNKDGVFQIGEEIHKITQNMEYIILNGDEAILANSDWENSYVEKFEIDFATTASEDTSEGGKAGNLNTGSKPSNQGARVFTPPHIIGWYT
jgi:hypothetical protein